jgi:hypothetical protein
MGKYAVWHNWLPMCQRKYKIYEMSEDPACSIHHNIIWY